MDEYVYWVTHTKAFLFLWLTVKRQPGKEPAWQIWLSRKLYFYFVELWVGEKQR